MEIGTMETRRGLNRDVIKYVAIGTMFLNHIATIFMEPGRLVTELFLNIGYFTAIVMCYFLVEGFTYTHSRRKYGTRLFLFALVSEVPFCLAFTTEGILSFYGLNMIATLWLCFLILLARERIVDPLGRSLVIAALILVSAFSDWALLAPVFTLLFAWARGSSERTKQAFVAATLLFGSMNLLGGLGRFSVGTNLAYALESMVGPALAGIVIVYFYNGKRMEKGRSFSKWFFYIFYPAHLLILGLLRIWMTGV